MSEIKQFDTVATPEGNATVVGLLPESGQVEVRYPTRALLIWGMTQVKLVEVTPGTTTAMTVAQAVLPGPAGGPQDAYHQAREAGVAPAVPSDAFGEEMVEPPVEAKRSTLAQQVAKDQPKMTRGEALARARAAKAAKRQES